MTEPTPTESNRIEPDEVARLKEENEALHRRLDRRTTVRKWTAVVFVVLTSLALVVSTVAVWAHETVFDTDQFMEVVEPALEDPAFYSAISDYASDQALEALAIEERVTTALEQLDAYISEALVDALDPDPRILELLQRFDRPSLTALAPPIIEALESRVVETIDAFFTSDEFRTRFPQLVRQVHEAAIALVRNDLAALPNVYIENGEVRLNLIPTITQALQRVLEEIRDFLPDVTLPDIVADSVQEGREQLAAALRAELPEDFGQLTIMTESSLSEIQQVARRVDRAVWLVVIVTILLAVATLAVSPNRRRTLIQLAVGVVAGFVLAMVIIRNLNDAILEEISSPDGVRAADALFAEVASSLGTLMTIIVVTAVLVGVIAYLAGRPAWLLRLRTRLSVLTEPAEGGSELDRWVSAHYDALRISGIAIAVGTVFLTGIALVPVLIVAAVLALYLWAIGAMSRRADATPSDVADAAGPEATEKHDTPV